MPGLLSSFVEKSSSDLLQYLYLLLYYVSMEGMAISRRGAKPIQATSRLD